MATKGGLWRPLRGLGNEALAVDRSLASETVAEASARLDTIARRGNEGSAGAVANALLAARAALAIRSADAPERAEALALAAREAFLRAGQGVEASWVDVERVALLGARRERAAEAEALAASLPEPEGDPALAAATLRARGALARARADLRTSLPLLERARELARAAGDVRESVRALNTLGTSYASLGVADAAREALEEARELAEASRQLQSAALASGQLAVLALDEGSPRAALRHLEAQRTWSERLGDVHGLARALALSAEAQGEARDPEAARRAAEACRGLYAAHPTPWTRLQAVMATLVEAEQALASADDERAESLLASCEEERTSGEPAWRLARARGAFAELWLALRDGGGGRSVATRITAAFTSLEHSPRPAWVERAASLASHVASRHGETNLAAALALRSVWVGASRRVAMTHGLAALRHRFPELALGRAMACGRDLVLRSRLALGPLRPFEAHVVVATGEGGEGSEGAAERALRVFEETGGPPAPARAWVALEGGATAVLATLDEAHARAALAALGGSLVVGAARGSIAIAATPSADLALVGAALAAARRAAFGARPPPQEP
ncbi:MAG: hypothetical protein MUF34_08395 [Polyangiaceae bacterium]|nr:hypothetical protein [Polyangiaceae bacterium]